MGVKELSVLGQTLPLSRSGLQKAIILTSRHMGSSLNSGPFGGPSYKGAVLYWGPEKGPSFRKNSIYPCSLTVSHKVYENTKELRSLLVPTLLIVTLIRH